MCGAGEAEQQGDEQGREKVAHDIPRTVRRAQARIVGKRNMHRARTRQPGGRVDRPVADAARNT